MLSYCFKCKKKKKKKKTQKKPPESFDPKVSATSNGCTITNIIKMCHMG